MITLSLGRVNVFMFYKIVSLLYYQLCLGIIASGIGFVLRPANVFCAKAKRQQKGFICAKAKRQPQQHDAGQLAVITWMR
ncbi:hypothetical protein ACPCXF_06250 [Lysinibacillus agricola]